MKKSGYVTEKLTIDLAMEVGFILSRKSEINANNKDTKELEISKNKQQLRKFFEIL